jgi:hypothetical protein
MQRINFQIAKITNSYGEIEGERERVCIFNLTDPSEPDRGAATPLVGSLAAAGEPIGGELVASPLSNVNIWDSMSLTNTSSQLFAHLSSERTGALGSDTCPQRLNTEDILAFLKNCSFKIFITTP